MKPKQSKADTVEARSEPEVNQNRLDNAEKSENSVQNSEITKVNIENDSEERKSLKFQNLYLPPPPLRFELPFLGGGSVFLENVLD